MCVRLLRHDHEHLPDFRLVDRIEQRDVDLGPPLPLEVDRQQVGTRGQQHPDDLAAVAGVAHLGGDHREHAARRARVAAPTRGCRAPRRPRRSTTTTGPIARSTPSTRSRLPSVSPTYFERKFLSMTHGTPIEPATHSRQERFAGADRAADQVAHRRGVELAALEQLRRRRAGALFAASWPTTVSRPTSARRTRAARGLALDQPLLELVEVLPIEPAADLRCRPHEDFEVGEPDARGQLAELGTP